MIIIRTGIIISYEYHQLHSIDSFFINMDKSRTRLLKSAFKLEIRWRLRTITSQLLPNENELFK